MLFCAPVIFLFLCACLFDVVVVDGVDVVDVVVVVVVCVCMRVCVW